MIASYGLLFPGQASQKVGMGSAAAAGWKSASGLFELAEQVTQLPIKRLCFEGPPELLVRTRTLQPCLVACELAILAAGLEASGAATAADPVRLATAPNPPTALAGHSVGEISALAAAGAISLSAALAVVALRADAMDRAGTKIPGSMAALIGGDLAAAHELCQKIRDEADGAILAVANINAPGQTVIAGDLRSIGRASQLARSAGFRRAIALPVSAAFHSAAMGPAAQELKSYLQGVEIVDPQIRVISNISALPLCDAESIRREIADQVLAPVRWSKSLKTLFGYGIRSFFEVGPGNVLAGTVSRTLKQGKVLPAGDADEIRVLAASLAGNGDG